MWDEVAYIIPVGAYELYGALFMSTGVISRTERVCPKSFIICLRMMIAYHSWIFFVISVIIISCVKIFKCHESYPGFYQDLCLTLAAVKNPSNCFSNRTGIFLYGKHSMRFSQKRLPKVKVKSGENSLHGITELKRFARYKRTKNTARNLSENFWESLNEFLRNYETIKGDSRGDEIQKPDNYVDVNQLLAVKDNYFTIPKSSIELLQLNNVCPRDDTEIHPCKTIFTRTRMVNSVWPRELITASCRCNGQRCSTKGLDTCTTLVSRITVIGRKGNRVRDYVPVACVCVAFKGNSARETLPLIV